MSNSSYPSMKDLIKSISNSLEKLDKGEMNALELNPLVESSRELYERLLILRFKALSAADSSTAQPDDKSIHTETKVREEVITTPFKLNVSGKQEEKPVQQVQASIFTEEAKVEEARIDKSVDEKKEETQVSKLKETQDLSLNEKLAQQQQKVSLGEKLQKKPIADLKTSIGLNQKFLFMNDLFEGENGAYNEAVEKLNNFSSLDDAKNYLLSLGTKYGWDLDLPAVNEFTDLVERRYA